VGSRGRAIVAEGMLLRERERIGARSDSISTLSGSDFSDAEDNTSSSRSKGSDSSSSRSVYDESSQRDESIDDYIDRIDNSLNRPTRRDGSLCCKIREAHGEKGGIIRMSSLSRPNLRNDDMACRIRSISRMLSEGLIRKGQAEDNNSNEEAHISDTDDETRKWHLHLHHVEYVEGLEPAKTTGNFQVQVRGQRPTRHLGGRAGVNKVVPVDLRSLEAGGLVGDNGKGGVSTHVMCNAIDVTKQRWEYVASLNSTGTKLETKDLISPTPMLPGELEPVAENRYEIIVTERLGRKVVNFTPCMAQVNASISLDQTKSDQSTSDTSITGTTVSLPGLGKGRYHDEAR
jgi:hypothetical protein